MEKGSGTVKTYRNENIIVYWYPELCAHPGTCLRLLPNVFQLDRRPWIDVNAAEPEEIIRAIDRCPSGALRYSLPEGSRVDPVLAGGVGSLGYEDKHPATVRIRTVRNGPMYVEGPAEVTDYAGNVLKRSSVLALCSCGRSKNLPFCDGSHRRNPDKCE